MSVSAAFGQLEHARKTLVAQWESARTEWADENARRFEEDVMNPLMIRIRQMERALNQLDGVLRKARHDCE